METQLLSVESPIECSIVQRINRFVVEVQVRGRSHLAWINNTGRLHQFLVPGRAGFCVERQGRGKTAYRLFAIREGSLGAVIDTHLQMGAFERCVERGLFPWLKGCRQLRRNVRLNNSVIDYLLECDAGEAYLEVKSAVLRQGLYAMYPDCPSARGRKHVQELTKYAAHAGRAYIVFIAALPGVEAFQPNRFGDAALPGLLVAAHKAGVEIRSVGMFYCPDSHSVDLFDPDLRIDL